jgi:type III restriction enzyme
MISLFPFQAQASGSIADRYREFITDPDRPTRKGYGKLPFYQSLQALTGAGKTPIIADALTQMRTTFPIEPVVLWVSKGKVVVDQTLANFDDGGKYHHLVSDFITIPLRDCTQKHIEETMDGLILMGTTALFNQKDKESRRIFEVQKDTGGISLWEALMQRWTLDGKKRPLIIFYDEGHNLTDQQSDLLMELKPEAFIMASATPKLPGRLAEIVDLLQRNGYDAASLGTAIKSTDIVEAGLVKREVQLGGYVTAEEAALSAMLTDYDDLKNVVTAQGAHFIPKCIYVCDTNIAHDELKPFASRSAPPIRIWRYLVETCNVDPSEIAVYCDLKVTQTQPVPPTFTLFRGGEDDYGKFVAGNFKHIIFNLSLQEGWDDPECYLAYIDKSMGSKIQVEQIIGRVLRQPSAQHYADAKLNTAGFYIHVTAEGVFKDILKEVQKKLSQDMPAVTLTSTGGTKKTIECQHPLLAVSLPSIGTDSTVAAEKVAAVLAKVSDYGNSGDAKSLGRYAEVTQRIGYDADNNVEWRDKGQGMPVTVQWLLRRLIERQYPAAFSVCDMDDERFSRLIQIGSRAAKQVEDQANEIVATFLEYTDISLTPGLSQKVGDALVDINDSNDFKNAVHPAYSGLNPDEVECAKAIDNLGWCWYRNPSNGGLRLPLLVPGKTRGFDPDFVIWTDTVTWLVDPKGANLIKEAAGRKLLSVESVAGQLPVKVCLITQGKWSQNFEQLTQDGVSAWRLRSGNVNRPEWYPDFGDLLKKVVGIKS